MMHEGTRTGCASGGTGTINDMPGERQRVPARRLKPGQPEWDEVDFLGAHRREPEPCIYPQGLPTGTLHALSGINRRSTSERVESGVGPSIQQ